MKRSCLLLIFVCAFLISATAQQPGYIITFKNDTLKGEFKTSAFGRPKFKARNSDATISINLDTIKEYQLTKDASVFIAEVLPKTSMNFIGRPQFVERLEHGKINLYEMVTPSGMHLKTWYITSNNDTLIPIKTDDMAIIGGGSKKKRRETLAKMMSDKPDIAASFSADNSFSYDKIRSYIKQYNNAVAMRGSR